MSLHDLLRTTQRYLTRREKPNLLSVRKDCAEDKHTAESLALEVKKACEAFEESGESRAFRKVLVAIDRHQGSKRALQLAIWLAELAGSDLVLVHVVSKDSTFDSECPNAAKVVRPALLRDARKLLDEAQSRVPGDIDVTTLLHEGEAALHIVDAARHCGANLIVIGTNTADKLGAYALGYTVNTILRNAPCPVLVAIDEAQRHKRFECSAFFCEGQQVPGNSSELK